MLRSYDTKGLQIDVVLMVEKSSPWDYGFPYDYVGWQYDVMVQARKVLENVVNIVKGECYFCYVEFFHSCPSVDWSILYRLAHKEGSYCVEPCKVIAKYAS